MTLVAKKFSNQLFYIVTKLTKMQFFKEECNKSILDDAKDGAIPVLTWIEWRIN
jgi:hypothetical protein